MKIILYLWFLTFPLVALGQALSLSDPAASRQAASAGWQPSDIAGLQLWLAADSGAYSDSSGTTPCNDGDAVAVWSDNSGNSRSFAQTNASAKPTYKTGIVNSKPVLRFDGSADFLYFTNNFTTNFTSACAFLVFKLRNDPTTNTASAGFWNFGGQSGSVANHFVYTNGDIWDDFGTSVRRQVGNPAFNMTDWTLYNVETESANFTARINTTNQYTSGGVNTVAWENSESYVAIGRSEVGSYFFDADVAELIIYNSVLSSSNRALVNGYLDTKYNLSY